MTVTEMARMGGQATAKKLIPKQRTESARKAAQARWAKEEDGVDSVMPEMETVVPVLLCRSSYLLSSEPFDGVGT